jgi:hypothetical protein
MNYKPPKILDTMQLNKKNIINIYQLPVLLFDIGAKIALRYDMTAKAVRIDLFEVTSTTK